MPDRTDRIAQQLTTDITAAHREWPALRLSDFIIYQGDTIRCPDGKERKVLAVSNDGYMVTVRAKNGHQLLKRIQVQVTKRQYSIPNIGDSLPISGPSSVVDLSQKGITVRFLCNMPKETPISDRRYHVTYRIEEFYDRAYPVLGPEPPTPEQQIAALARENTRLRAELDRVKKATNPVGTRPAVPTPNPKAENTAIIHREPPPINQILVADALTYLQRCEDNSVHCAITSPPYWGLRSYLDTDHPEKAMELGQEPTFEEYLHNLITIFGELHRVLRPDGTLWLNMGDGHAGSWGNYHPTGKGGQRPKRTKRYDRKAYADPTFRPPSSRPPNGLKPKDLIGQPWTLAFALRDMGFSLRADIIWQKPNPMPSSATDRVTIAHEYVFLLAKSCTPQYWTHRDQPGTHTKPKPDYRWIDALTEEETDQPPENWRTETLPDGSKRWARINLWSGHDYYYDHFAIREPGSGMNGGGFSRAYAEAQPNHGAMQLGRPQVTGRNKRSVWAIATQPYKHAHFATFPPKLIEPMILTGCPPKVCAQCGAPYERMVKKSFIPQQDVSLERGIKGADGQKPMAENNQWAGVPRGTNQLSTTGWQPTCDCKADAVPGIALDCFMGSGTTALVAQKLNRRFLGCDLNPDYVEMARMRLQNREPELIAKEKGKPFTKYMFPTTTQEPPHVRP